MELKHKSDFLKRGINKAGKPYGSWTKEGVRAWCLYVMHHPEALAEISLHTVAQNIKLSALMFSTPAGPGSEMNAGLGTCGHLPCVEICYALRAESFRPSALLADMENAMMLKYDFERAVAEFVKALRKYDAKCRKAGVPTMVRWHQSGEFTPEDSALLDRVAEMFPGVKFYGYTKKEEYYVKYYDHHNVNILWSAWRGMPIPKAVLACGKLKAFFVKFEDGKNEYLEPYRKGARRCPGLIKGEFACNKCKFACAGRNIVIAHEH